MRCSIWPGDEEAEAPPYDTVELLKQLNAVGARYWGELPDTTTLPLLLAPPRDAGAFLPRRKPGTNLVIAATGNGRSACSRLKAVELANLTSPSLAEVIDQAPDGHQRGPKDAAPRLLVPTPCRSLGLMTINPTPNSLYR